MRAPLVVAAAALAVASALVVPAVDVLAPDLRELHRELAEGEFKPLEGTPLEHVPAATTGPGYEERAGGVTGRSEGNFLAQPASLPSRWAMDRDASAGDVVVDYVFDPALGSMKRLKAWDVVDEEGALRVGDDALEVPVELPGASYDRTFRGRFPVRLVAGAATPIYSPDPEAIVEVATSEPRVPGGLAFYKDGADTFYVRAREGGFEGIVNLSVTFRARSVYFELTPPPGATVGAYGPAAPVLDAALDAKAQRVLGTLGLAGERRLDVILATLVDYFSGFGEGPIPPASEYQDAYEAIVYGQNGCCRHRAYAFAVTAQAAGIPTRVVANEAHAFVEILVPGVGWQQQNLGGCGSYAVRNPGGYREYHAAANDPRTPPDPRPETPPAAIPTETILTSWPDVIRKGTPFAVQGRVVDANGNGVKGADVDVFLNATKTAPGHLVGRGRTDDFGFFDLRGDVPREAPARTYQLVAHAHPVVTERGAWRGSWSDPEVRVESATRFELDVPPVDGADLEVPVRGRLVDVLGGPVAARRVTLIVDGAPFEAAETDADGAFSFGPIFHSRGAHQLRFRFAGDSSYDASEATAILVVQDTSLDVPRAVHAVRGEPARLAGRVVRDGEGLPGRVLAVTLPFDADARGEALFDGRAFGVRAGEGGAFELVFTPRASAIPGTASIVVEDRELGLRRNVTVRLDVRPVLALAALAPGGENATLVARLTDDAGAPLAGETVEARLGGRSWNATTDAAGQARMPLPALAPGAHDAEASFAGRGPYLSASGATRVVVAGAGGAPDPGAAAAVLALLAALAAGAWAFRRSGVWGRLAAARAAARARRAPRLVVTFPGLEPDVPPVAAPGDAIAVRVQAVRADGRPVAGADLRLEVAGAVVKLRTDANGTAELRLPGRGEGAVEIVARVGAARARAVARVAEYRRALEDEWRDLVGAAAAAGVPVDAASSPREVEGALAAAGVERALADRLVALYEVSSFSERPVARREFVAFARAAGVVHARLAARAPVVPEVAPPA